VSTAECTEKRQLTESSIFECFHEILRRAAFPRAKVSVLDSYVQDSICGTWEVLADAVFPGGAPKLGLEGYPRIGEEKCKWASLIGPHLDIESNRSPSLLALKDGLLKLSGSRE
jgi:hypothetical protein